MTTVSASHLPISTEPKQTPLKKRSPLLHYAAYFFAVSSVVFIAQTGEPKQKENALLAGAISAASVVTRDWYKARLSPSLAADPDGLIELFSEMLDAGRAQANTNAAQLKRVSFLQTDLIEAMRDLNDQLRLNPEEVDQRLREIQTANLTNALPTINVPKPLADSAVNNSAVPPTAGGTTRIPDSTTLRQSEVIRRPGFDA